MPTDIAKKDTAAGIMERVVVKGDLSVLTEHERLEYYAQVCKSLGLNPLTQPFAYIHLNGKLTLYATRTCTDQLRTLKGVSISKIEREFMEGIYTVTVYATDAKGRMDSDIGAVNIDGLRGEAKSNAIMKCTTKAKRRVTLSICGLGMMDESEVEGMMDEQGDRTFGSAGGGEIDDERMVLKASIEESLRKRGASKRDAKIHFKAYLGAEDPEWSRIDPAVLKDFADKLALEPGTPGAA